MNWIAFNKKANNISFSAIFFIFLLGISCSSAPSGKDKNINKEIHFRKDGTLFIQDKNKEIAKFDIEIADDEYERETGLMYRKNMKDHQAMLFIFNDENPRYFYMKNTYIPLDIIFIDRNNKIVHIAKNAKPLDETTLASRSPAQYVLEIKAGLSDDWGITPGMKVQWNSMIKPQD